MSGTLADLSGLGSAVLAALALGYTIWLDRQRRIAREQEVTPFLRRVLFEMHPGHKAGEVASAVEVENLGSGDALAALAVRLVSPEGIAPYWTCSAFFSRSAFSDRKRVELHECNTPSQDVIASLQLGRTRNEFFVYRDRLGRFYLHHIAAEKPTGVYTPRWLCKQPAWVPWYKSLLVA